jgi:hypothetical protein
MKTSLDTWDQHWDYLRKEADDDKKTNKRKRKVLFQILNIGIGIRKQKPTRTRLLRMSKTGAGRNLSRNESWILMAILIVLVQ